jgi:hypothetical protein
MQEFEKLVNRLAIIGLIELLEVSMNCRLNIEIDMVTPEVPI